MEDRFVYEGRISPLAIACDIFWCFFLIGFYFLARDLNVKLTISTTRVTGSQGLLRREQMDSPLNKITGVKVEKGLLGSIFNYGKIGIRTAGNIYYFTSMDRPNEFARMLNDQIEVYEEEIMKKQAEKIAKAMKS